MEYTSVINPVWADAQNTVINCQVIFPEVSSEYLPFTANPQDTSNPSSKEIYNQCVAGTYGAIGAYVPPAPYVPTAQDNKSTASKLLYETDWTTIADVASPTNSPYLANQADFIAYRNEIRKIAVNPVAGNINWPTKPTEQWAN